MSRRKALVIGNDYYENENIHNLHGCVNDAYEVKGALERHGDSTVNFEVKLLTGTGEDSIASKEIIEQDIQALFASDCETVLFYFAGHGHIESTGGYIIPGDARTNRDGIALSDIMTWADNSPATNKIVVLDSCHSGIAGSKTLISKISELSEGTTILTASTAEQYASEENGAGVFTTLFVDALNGAASNLLGHITPGSIYAHIDQSLGEWDEQRPVFKTNVKEFVSLRKVQPPINLRDLLRITEFFPNPGFEYQLNPTYEPERSCSCANEDTEIPAPDPENTAVFSILQSYVKVNLLRPVDAPHMWHAAMKSKACKLTVLGEHYRELVEKERI